MPSKKKSAATKPKTARRKTPKMPANLRDAGVIRHKGSQTEFFPEPSWTGPGAGGPAAQRFKHWVCSDDNTCVPVEESERFTENINWRIFRIMAEFVEGFEFLSELQKEVTFFGSARAMPEHPAYKMARELGNRLGEAGYTVITGGGPGIMEAGNRGAFEVGGNSVGLDIQLPTEQRRNKFVRMSKGFHYFFTRKVMLSASAQAYVFFPGGFGTFDELFEVVTLIQTGKMSDQVPVILIGKEYWSGLLKWITDVVQDKNHFIESFEFKILRLVDSVDEAYDIIKKTHERTL
jgi:uncharacterized protein (TIGR00730 family)